MACSIKGQYKRNRNLYVLIKYKVVITILEVVIAFLCAGSGTVAKNCVVAKKSPTVLDPSAESPVNLPGLRRSLVPKWSNGWSWEGTSFKAKVFLNVSNTTAVNEIILILFVQFLLTLKSIY